VIKVITQNRTASSICFAMRKKDITSKEDVERLIRNFYLRVLSNEELNHFFSHAIQDWDDHMKRFINYWSHHVLFTDSYRGSALHGHEKIDAQYDHAFRDHHFQTWLDLFEKNVDQLFAGPKAELAKEVAQNMADKMYKKMFIGRRTQFVAPKCPVMH